MDLVVWTYVSEPWTYKSIDFLYVFHTLPDSSLPEIHKDNDFLMVVHTLAGLSLPKTYLKILSIRS